MYILKPITKTLIGSPRSTFETPAFSLSADELPGVMQTLTLYEVPIRTKTLIAMGKKNHRKFSNSSISISRSKAIEESLWECVPMYYREKFSKTQLQ